MKSSWHDINFTDSFSFPFLLKKRLIILGLKYLFIQYHDYILRRVESPYHILFYFLCILTFKFLHQWKLNFIISFIHVHDVTWCTYIFWLILLWVNLNFLNYYWPTKASSFLLGMHEEERTQLFIVLCTVTVNVYPLAIMHLLFISWKLASISSMSASSRFILFLFLCCSTSR